MAVNITAITAVVAMIPRRFTLWDGEEVEQFCCLLQPGLDVSMLRMPYNIYEDNDELVGNVE